MAKKKKTPLSVSQEETVQAQHVFEHYHQVAHNLCMSKDQKQAETALAEITTLPERAQIALLKALAKDHQVDAADILTALHELSPLKTVRKEARRSLIQLEGAKIYPRWEPPLDRTAALSAIQRPTNPPRFWKGMIEGSRAMGIAHLLLFWEQGEDYKEVRVLGFYLDFPHEGVKDFFTRVESKRNTEQYIADIKAKTRAASWRKCEVVEGHALVRNALAIHARRDTKPPTDYQSHLSLINQLLLEAEDAALDEESSTLYNNLDPMGIVVNFVEAWASGDYDMAYDFLSQESPLREGLSREEWMKRREAWAAEAIPSDVEPSYISERQQHKSRLWLPASFTIGYGVTHQEIEAGWSLEMAETPLGETLPELPRATAIYEESGRHWFWANYTLVQENSTWRIQRMTDEGLITPTISIEDLEDEIDDLYDQLETLLGQYSLEEIKELEETVVDSQFYQVLTHLMQSVYYTDALISKFPFDQSHYEAAARRMLSLGQYERCLAYLTPMIERFPRKRALYLRQKARVERRLSKKYAEQENHVRAERHEELARQSVRESLALENTFEGQLLLAELLVGNDAFDEAEDHLLQAKELLANLEENTIRHGRTVVDQHGDEVLFSEVQGQIEFHLGEIAWERDDSQETLSHYQRAAELLPDSPHLWFGIGEAHQALEHFEEAEANYKHAIELDAQKAWYYTTLSDLYAEHEHFSKAITVLEEGLAANPDSIDLRLAMASLYTEMGHYRQAELLVNKAERINPESPLVHSFRKSFTVKKRGQTPATKKQSKPLK